MTNRVYEETYPEGTPSGKRDRWSESDQKRIVVGEHFATREVKKLPDPTPQMSQEQANDRVVDAAGQGAKQGREYVTDKKENGNWWSNNGLW